MHQSPPPDSGLVRVDLPVRQSVRHAERLDDVFVRYWLHEPGHAFVLDLLLKVNEKSPAPFVWSYPGGAMVLQRHPPWSNHHGAYPWAYLVAGPFDNEADALSALRLIL